MKIIPHELDHIFDQNSTATVSLLINTAVLYIYEYIYIYIYERMEYI